MRKKICALLALLLACALAGCGGGEVIFTYEDRKATDPAPFDGDDRNGEVLVSVRVEPTADGEAAHSATLKHDGSKENFEITVEDTVALH